MYHCTCIFMPVSLYLLSSQTTACYHQHYCTCYHHTSFTLPMLSLHQHHCACYHHTSITVPVIITPRSLYLLSLHQQHCTCNHQGTASLPVITSIIVCYHTSIIASVVTTPAALSCIIITPASLSCMIITVSVLYIHQLHDS